MASPNNTVILRGGLTRDPVVNEKIKLVEMSIAIDGAGSEKGSSFPAGFFDAKVWMNDSDYTPGVTAKNVQKALDAGELRKGSRVAILGELRHERWEKDGKRDSKVTVIVDRIDIFTSTRGGGVQSQQVSKATSVNDDDADNDEPSFIPNF